MTASNAQVVILAGGQGTRFWPISRQKFPKQFLPFTKDGKSLIQCTAVRAARLTPGRKLLVLTTPQQTELVREHVPDASILLEPFSRNTAAAIAFAALSIKREDPERVMVVLPADHAVEDENKLLSVLNEAIGLASARDVLVTIGVKPGSPHTGYGYLRKGHHLHNNAFEVARFFEKPNLERATLYASSEQFLWNSGMFVWKARVLLEGIAAYMPELYQGLCEIDRAWGSKEQEGILSRVFEGVESVSIDLGLLEYAKNCCLVEANDFGWSDVGSWDAWSERLPVDKMGNVVVGDAMLIDSSNCVVHSEKRFSAIIGAQDLVLIDSGDALLVCPKDRLQDVRQIVEELKRKGRKELI